MRLGLSLGPIDPRAFDPAIVLRAEELGYDSVWTSESYGADAVTPAAFLAARTRRIGIGTAVMQMSARVPAMTAMTAMTLDHLSGGRFRMGLGLSGPALVEGWHGTAYGRPLRRTEEYVSIVRQVLRREPLEHHGSEFDVPYSGDGTTGLGRPMKLISIPVRPDLPIYIAAIGPRNVELAMRIADGWLPAFCSPIRMKDVWGDALAIKPHELDIAASVPVVLGDDVDACRRQVKPRIGLYMGGMGPPGRNFYNNLARRYGYETAAEQVQNLFLDRRMDQAIAAVPDELVDEVALCGPAARIEERLVTWMESPVTTLLASTDQVEALELLAQLLL